MIKLLTTALSILLLMCIGVTQAYATSLGDISPAGWPRFETDASIKWTQKGKNGFRLHTKLNGGGDMFFMFSSSESYQVTDGSYQLKANLDASGNFLSGDVKITGSIAHFGITSSVLMTATLDSFAYDSNTLAFNTSDIDCPFFDFCTTNESVWINLDTGGFDPALKKFTDTGLAITTVPVPAAVWLFGSGILGLASTARRKRKTA